MDTNILLESGTNELEVLEFMVDGNHYGINVAKIREIISYTTLTPIPNGHRNVEGTVSTRGETITVVNLARALGLTENEDTQNDMFLITNFNGVNTGFHVHSVVGIHRVNWSQIIKPDRLISGTKESVVTGIINLQEHLVLLLDFENIVAQISPESGIQLDSISHMDGRSKNNKPILFAEDSQLLSMMIYDGLTQAGYTNVIPLNNGKELWDLLEQYREEGVVEEKVACIITDIEMPQMDGHRLLKLVKEHPVYNNIPVLIFSSLINEEMRKKGERLGADAQLSKNQMVEFIQTLDRILAD